MTVHERAGLIARIRHIRRTAAAADKRAASNAVEPDSDRIGALEARITHLERLVEGLQDSVHRESERQGRLIAELQAQVHPAAVRAALTKHARDRGL